MDRRRTETGRSRESSKSKTIATAVPTRPLIPRCPIPVSTSLKQSLPAPPHLEQRSLATLSSQPLVPLPPWPTMAQPPTYPAHRPTIPHSNTPTDRSIPTNYQAAPRLSFYPSTLNYPENRVGTLAMWSRSLSTIFRVYKGNITKSGNHHEGPICICIL